MRSPQQQQPGCDRDDWLSPGVITDARQCYFNSGNRQALLMLSYRARGTVVLTFAFCTTSAVLNAKTTRRIAPRSCAGAALGFFRVIIIFCVTIVAKNAELIQGISNPACPRAKSAIFGIIFIFGAMTVARNMKSMPDASGSALGPLLSGHGLWHGVASAHDKIH